MYAYSSTGYSDWSPITYIATISRCTLASCCLYKMQTVKCKKYVYTDWDIYLVMVEENIIHTIALFALVMYGDVNEPFKVLIKSH